MIVRFNPSALRDIGWYQYVVRFVLGGTMTVIAGLIASRWGPVVGGLFLAFPAIFPASVTLIEKHVRERKEKIGLSGSRRGKEAAALDAAGAVLGSLGLAAFAAVIWLLIEQSYMSSNVTSLCSTVLGVTRRQIAGSSTGAPTSHCLGLGSRRSRQFSNLSHLRITAGTLILKIKAES